MNSTFRIRITSATAAIVALALMAACDDDTGTSAASSPSTTTSATTVAATAATSAAPTTATSVAPTTVGQTSVATIASTTAPAPTSTSEARPTTTPGSSTSEYAPVIDPADFVTTIDNPYMPWTVGAKWVYESDSEHIEVVVTDEQRMVMGIPVVVVRDTASEDNEVTEDTFDYYAQDKDGNVWYMGEDTKEYDGGTVTSTEGSWEAGVDGALPGILMPATFTVGEVFQQEYYVGVAEDMGQLVEVGTTQTVHGTEYTDVVVFKEWSPLDSGNGFELKYYAPGVGVILVTSDDGSNREELVEHS